MTIQEFEARSIIVKSNIPDADYAVNPYIGCQFGCLYCYATFMGRFVQEARSNWGNYVYAKTNAVELARKQLSSWSPKSRKARILFSSVTDPYQGAEKRYRLTRGILQVLVDGQYPGLVSILTKSPLVLRDIDLLGQLPHVEVGLTVTTTDDGLSRFLEVRAPSASRRLSTLSELVEREIPAFAFVGPLLPHFRYQPEWLDALFGEIAGAGVTQVYVEHINLPSYVRERLWKELRSEPEEVRAMYKGARTEEHRQALSQIVDGLVAKHVLQIRLGGAMYHPQMQRSESATR